jgi:alpha-amylase/alpha-mannosidase (GH57 family)
MINFCIHGHFYQPPRENPWSGEIDKQDSASPYHDWNERIYNECYKPNSEAVVSDSNGKIISSVNNYQFLNFNFGPTLLSWIKEKHPETYLKIIEADKNSIKLHNGHGNAIAQVYSHMIMPLSNLNDKITQVKWGLKYFEYHFGRNSEGIWLAETACNDETIEVLINEKVKYIILDVCQAESVRKFGEDTFFDVSNNNIIPLSPYRCFSNIDSTKYLDIFFYDGPFSKSVAFDDVMFNSENLLNKVRNIGNQNNDNLLSIATDGETFGHHKKGGHLTFAYFFHTLSKKNNIKILNYGEFLEINPPQYEVVIKKGDNGEGTSWSCSHGVKRWNEDCGCGGGGEWHQKWRKPLRESLNWLRDKLIDIYESEASRYLNDVWKARNEYIEILIDSSEDSINHFINNNSRAPLRISEINTILDLLEMQRYSMLMFTSCGWFFSEISGLESVKILEYASRAVEIAETYTDDKIENDFLVLLEKAPSNLKEYKHGRGVYEKLVIPQRNNFKKN